MNEVLQATVSDSEQSDNLSSDEEEEKCSSEVCRIASIVEEERKYFNAKHAMNGFMRFVLEWSESRKRSHKTMNLYVTIVNVGIVLLGKENREKPQDIEFICDDCK